MKRTVIITLVHCLAAATCFSMPADSTAYYKLGSVSMLSVDFRNLPISQIPVTPGNIIGFQLAIYSNPNVPVNVDYINRSAGWSTSGRRDRGGEAIINGTTLKYRAGAEPWNSPNCNSPSSPDVGKGYFNENAYQNSAPRGWAKISYRYSSTSFSQMAQPYAVRKRAIAVGGFSTEAHEGSQGNGTRVIPLGPIGLSSNRILSLQYLFHGFDPNEVKQTSAGPAGPGGARGVAHPITINGSLNAIVMDFNSFGTGFDDADHKNRGFVLLDYLAAECNDGAGGWSGANIGSRTVQAYVNQATTLSSYSGCHGTKNGTHVIENTGNDIWGNTSDAFRYVYKSGSGNKNLVIRVDQVENTNAWARAGIMIRENTTTGSRNVAVFVTPGNGVRFQARTAPGGTTSTIASATGIKAPIWLRLEYTSGTTRAYRSTNGTSWTQLGSSGVSASFSSYLYGMAAASRSNYPNTSVYSNVNF